MARKVFKPTTKFLKECTRVKYGYNGKYVSVSDLAKDLYFLLISEEFYEKYKIRDGIIKVTSKVLLNKLLDKRLTCFSGAIGMALRVLHDSGAIEILEVRKTTRKTTYIIKVK